MPIDRQEATKANGIAKSLLGDEFSTDTQWNVNYFPDRRSSPPMRKRTSGRTFLPQTPVPKLVCQSKLHCGPGLAHALETGECLRQTTPGVR